MKFQSLALASAVLALAGIAQAHTHLASATPADNSVVASPPTRIVLHFSEPTRLTALTIQKEGEKGPKHISALPTDASASLSIPIEPLAPGKYAISWRAVGDDSHLMSGMFHFTVAAK